jgi:lysophospholipase L1-like esterase
LATAEASTLPRSLCGHAIVNAAIGGASTAAKKVSVALIDSYNALLPQPAKEARALFTPFLAMPERHTLDGIHLNAAGCEVWDKAILQGIEAALCKSSCDNLDLCCHAA